MPRAPRVKRQPRPRTEAWQEIQHYVLWPGQGRYEEIRPQVLFHETPA